MFLRLYTFRRFCTVFNISRANMNLEKCYFRHIPDEEKIDITFLLKIKNNIRQFNFSRKTTETLQTLFLRIGTNVQKAVNKSEKKKGSSDSTFEVKMYDSTNSDIPKEITCLDLFSLKGPTKLKISDFEFEAIFNTPWVVNVKLPNSILAGFVVSPENFVTHYTVKEYTTFNWYTGITVNDKGNEINLAHVSWTLVNTGFRYTPKTQDIGMKLKLECVPGNETLLGPVVEAISKNVIEAGPGKCPFETRHKFTEQLLKNNRFRCVTYNILADLYCDSDFTRSTLHPYCPPYALHIDYRKQLILKELLGYNADIICLQEVDCKIFNHYLVPSLQSDDLKGLFYRKGKEVAEGLACFYRNDRFRFLSDERIVLSEVVKTESYLASIWDAIKDNKPLTERLLNRSTVACATILQSSDNPNEILLVGNTHLYFHPDADHIRALQGGIFIYWIKEIKENLQAKYPESRISVILCGDFNSVPSCGIYKLYTTGEALRTLPDWTSNIEEAVTNLDLKQDILLASACGTPEYTNFTAGFADCLDYIFYEKTNLEVEQVVPFPSLEELTANTALPSVVFPSDHIALISDLSFK